MQIEFPLKAFRFPNFVFVDAPVAPKDLAGGWGMQEAPKLSVGTLTDDQARAYWKDMEERWMEHVRSRREALGAPNED